MYTFSLLSPLEKVYIREEYQMKKTKYARYSILTILMVITLMISGCGTTLTDEQNRIIAEYAADLLLEYDAEYQAKYGGTEAEDMEAEDTEADTTEDTTEPSSEDEEPTTEEPVTEEPETTEDTTETAEPVTEEDSDTSDVSEASTEPVAQEDTTDPPSSNDNVADIAEIVGISGLSITYSKCLFLDRYPSIDQDGAFIYLDADPGYKLAVIKFNIVNQTSQSIMLDLLNTDIDYRLVLNKNKAAKPMLTILMDDLGTYSNSVPASSDQSAVLVFQISESSLEKVDNLDLKVTYNHEERIIHIQ